MFAAHSPSPVLRHRPEARRKRSSSRSKFKEAKGAREAGQGSSPLVDANRGGGFGRAGKSSGKRKMPLAKAVAVAHAASFNGFPSRETFGLDEAPLPDAGRPGTPLMAKTPAETSVYDTFLPHHAAPTALTMPADDDGARENIVEAPSQTIELVEEPSLPVEDRAVGDVGSSGACAEDDVKTVSPTPVAGGRHAVAAMLTSPSFLSFVAALWGFSPVSAVAALTCLCVAAAALARGKQAKADGDANSALHQWIEMLQLNTAIQVQRVLVLGLVFPLAQSSWDAVHFSGCAAIAAFTWRNHFVDYLLPAYQQRSSIFSALHDVRWPVTSGTLGEPAPASSSTGGKDAKFTARLVFWAVVYAVSIGTDPSALGLVFIPRFLDLPCLKCFLE
jgi:hypothetical protein